MRMKKVRIVLCILCFAAICSITVFFWSIFQNPGDLVFQNSLQYERCEILDGNGIARELDPDSPRETWGYQEGETYRMTIRLPDLEELPELYDEGYIGFTYSGMDMSVLLNGEEILHSIFREPVSADLSYSEATLPVEPEWAGAELTLLYRPLNPDDILYPYYSNLWIENRYMIAYANNFGISAGAFTMIFLVVGGLFLISLALETPDFSLIVLALVAGINAFWHLASGLSYYFLSKEVSDLIGNQWFALFPLALMILYLSLNRKRSFWKYFGLTLLVSAGFLVCWNGLRLLLDPDYWEVLKTYFYLFISGYALSSWGLEYLVTVCCGIALFNLTRTQLSIRSEANALSARQTMLLENYQNMERSIRETALMRHEWRHHVTSLHLLTEKKDIEGLSLALSQLDTQLERLSPRQYSRNFTVNIILQNAGARAADAGIDFSASAPLPETLGIESGDLCSLLINMLDNAIEAASHAEPDRRRISVSLKLNQGFLAIQCENTYSGSILLEENKIPSGDHVSSRDHGFGIAQMRLIAKKYGGILNISWTDQIFTVQTALNMK